jgi:hypothetical protein
MVTADSKWFNERTASRHFRPWHVKAQPNDATAQLINWFPFAARSRTPPRLRNSREPGQEARDPEHRRPKPSAINWPVKVESRPFSAVRFRR